MTYLRRGAHISPFLFAVYLDDLAKLCNRKSNVFIILYADDILLLAPSVCELDNLFKICKRELKLLDMTINLEIVLYSHWTSNGCTMCHDIFIHR